MKPWFSAWSQVARARVRSLIAERPLARFALPDRRWDHEVDFLPAALEIIERPASPGGRALAGALSALVVVALLWACIGQIDIIASAPGTILPAGNSKLVQPFETGVVAAIRVGDGDHVARGQVVLELNPTTAAADREKYAVDLAKTQLEIARLKGLRETIAGRPARLIDPPLALPPYEIEAATAGMRAQAAEQQAKLAGIEQQIVAKAAEQEEATAGIAKLQASLPYVSQETEVRRAAMQIQFGNKIAWLEAEQRLAEQQHEIIVLGHHRDESVAAEAALHRQREQTQAEYEKTVLTDLAQAEQKAAEFGKELEKASQRADQQTLRAPIDGTVQQLAIHTIGGVVTPAQALMVIVPDDDRLEVEAHIQNKDVGFVHAGEEVAVKIETFNFTRYGLIAGTVLNVSRDAVTSSDDAAKHREGDKSGTEDDKDHAPKETGGYIARVALARTAMMTEGGPVDLGPGMNVTAEIKIGQRRVISYLLSPIVRYRQESLREK